MAINLVISIFEYLIHKNFMLVQPYCLEPWIPRMAMEIGATGPSKYHSNPFELKIQVGVNMLQHGAFKKSKLQYKTGFL